MLQWLVAAAVLSAATGTAAAGPAVLRVLAWPGYAEPQVVRSFEARTGARVELTVIDTDESMWQRLNAHGGQDFDVFAVNTAELQRYIQAGLVQPLAPEKIPNTEHQQPRFRLREAIPGLVHKQAAGARTYAIPFTYSEMGLIYDRRQISVPPTSIGALWDPRYQGKVIVYGGGTHNFSLAAQKLGAASPFRIDQALWPRTVEALIDLRRNVLGFYNQPEESISLFRRHGAALMYANYGTQQLHLLKSQGIDAGYAIPREGALAWLDCWAITRGARDPALAHAWIDELLGDQASKLLVEHQGLASTTTASAASQPDVRLIWLEPVEDANRRETLWARVRSGDRASKVLAP
ncbi:ABC transporter substrate-binding protein [Ideonella sp. YS5]|uniref:ABC transporter substrate-binding protein n=1 Tax=Ideonella sp. YS5 TaxID=3453714 RepID=UPI003EEF5FDD